MFASVCFYSEFVKILIGRIPGVIIMYVASILEKMVTFVSCIYNDKYHRSTAKEMSSTNRGSGLVLFSSFPSIFFVVLKEWFFEFLGTLYLKLSLNMHSESFRRQLRPPLNDHNVTSYNKRCYVLYSGTPRDSS